MMVRESIVVGEKENVHVLFLPCPYFATSQQAIQPAMLNLHQTPTAMLEDG